MTRGLIEAGPESQQQIRHFENKIHIRGCTLSLATIKTAYRELQALSFSKGSSLVSGLTALDGETHEQLEERKRRVADGAFRITVTIAGFDGVRAFGDNESIFDADDLPYPINIVYFTNKNSFRSFANGELPEDRFEFFLDFGKPPAFDPDPLVSAPTPNTSNFEIQSNDLAYFNAAQRVIETRILSKRHWYAAIHGKFVYDIGLWFFGMPIMLYITSFYTDHYFDESSRFHYLYAAVFIYSLGMQTIFYRFFTGYVKWAYPVNVLTENKDLAHRHRYIIGVVFLGIIGGLLSGVFLL